LREGGGQLSDDIPPPTADERAAAEAEKGLGRLEPPLIPGLELAASPPALAQIARAAPRSRPEGESERLRSLLEEALRELEALRVLLR
jgi:hypothetical protein